MRASHSENEKLRLQLSASQIAGNGPGVQRTKTLLEGIIKEQRVNYDVICLTHGNDIRVLQERIYSLEDMCNQGQGPAVTGGAESSGYISGIRAAAGLSENSAPSKASRRGGNLAGGRETVLPSVGPSFIPAKLPITDGLTNRSVVPPILGMSSAGVPTSGKEPKSAYLGTPREGRSRSPTDKAIKDVSPTPRSAGSVSGSHRGMGAITIGSIAGSD